MAVAASMRRPRLPSARNGMFSEKEDCRRHRNQRTAPARQGIDQRQIAHAVTLVEQQVIYGVKNHAPKDESYLDKTDMRFLPDDKTECKRGIEQRGERGEQPHEAHSAAALQQIIPHGVQKGRSQY